MTVVVRAALETDAHAVARLTHHLGYEPSASAVKERLLHILSREDQQLFVAETDREVVGWVHVVACEYLEADAFVVVGGLVVDRLHRRNGIGRLLMSRGEEWARQRGYSTVRLSSSATRTEAHLFYEALGYVNIKTQYSFARSLDEAGRDQFSSFVPRIDP